MPDVFLIILVVLALALAFLTIAAARDKHDAAIPFIFIFTVLVFFLGWGVSERVNHLSNVEGLCRGNLEFSWQTPKAAQKEFEEELVEYAKCDVRFSRGDRPPAFP